VPKVFKENKAHKDLQALRDHRVSKDQLRNYKQD
jgi:hypothetical protein